MNDEIVWEVRYWDNHQQHPHVALAAPREAADALYLEKCESWNNVQLVKITRSVQIEKITKRP